MEKIIKEINEGNVVSMPTDTVYGLFGLVNNETKQKINILKQRDKNQPLQVMFPSIEQSLESFIMNKEFEAEIVDQLKKGNSILVEANTEWKSKLGEENILIRISTAPNELIDILKQTGPLYATSANITNKDPLTSKEDINSIFNISVAEGNIGSGNSSEIYSFINEQKKIR